MKKLQRFLSIFGALAFFSSTAFATTQLFRNSNSSDYAAEDPSQNVTVEDHLSSQERGYLKVLEREPKNRVALEGLVMTRLQMNNLEGVVEPLEALIEINPEETTYQTLYGELQEQLNATQADESDSPSSEESP